MNLKGLTPVLVTVFAVGLMVTAPADVWSHPNWNPLDRGDRITMQGAVDRWRSGDTQGAILRLESVISRNPNQSSVADTFFHLLDRHATDTDFTGAVRRYFKRNKRTGDFINIVDRATIADTQRLRIFKWGVDRWPQSPDILMIYLRTALNLGQDTVPARYKSDFESHFPRDPDLVELYADWFAKRGEWKRARILYRRLTSIRPGSPSGYRGLARWHEQRGNTERQERLQSRANALDN